MLLFARMSQFTRAQVEAIAVLAQLELDESEIDLFARQLGEILDYVDQLQKIDTTGVPPTAAIGTRHAIDRPDETRPSLDRRAALANGPDVAVDAGLFKVPRVIT
jgi:aspartyl-tRNA(Asn)/glutamyl-tRNA(Gln) amidotransferase subunit C